MVVVPKKSLGQHWLSDTDTLNKIANLANIEPTDTILEIGPGTGTLTAQLIKRADKVIAVELDENLASHLDKQFQTNKLEVINESILDYDLNNLPKNYKVVANVPYYITSKIIRKLMTANNKPKIVVLLVQKEVAERLAASTGKMSVLSISAQVYAKVLLGPVVGANLFTPPPKVDSQVVILQTLVKPLIDDEKTFFRVVKAGFSSPRKKLRSSLSGGLGISKNEAENYLRAADVNGDFRAEQLKIDDWSKLSQVVAT